MSGCPECGAHDWDWWTEQGARVLLCEVCGYSEREAVKFAECDCTASEEDWELIESPCDGAPVATYRCGTCGEVQSG